MYKIFILIFIPFIFSGCIVGTVVALPFKAVGAAVNTVAPDIVGDSISTVGNVTDAIIPF
ncbi:MAG: hypothetical protein COB17_06485 [Sulfurimonas sp.]|nr:MAG: hypothetical protein COB17_06485 [Sulfurimonas sp.]